MPDIVLFITPLAGCSWGNATQEVKVKVGGGEQQWTMQRICCHVYYSGGEVGPWHQSSLSFSLLNF